MDLSRIENWTRDMLEAEAKRRGIRDPDLRSRSELIRLILRNQYGARIARGRERLNRGLRTLKSARELVGVALDAAASTLPEPLETLVKLRAGLPLEPTPSEPSAVPPPFGEPTTWEDREAEARGEIPDEPEPAHDASNAPEPSADAEALGRQAAPAVAMPPPPVPTPTPSTRSFTEEPIRTHSMARLLAAQGHRERALAIYEELLALGDDASELSEEAARLRAGEVPQAAVLPEPPPLHELTLPRGTDLLELGSDAERRLSVRWEVSDGGRNRARAVLGREGELAVRLVTIGPDPERVVASHITEHGPVEARGEWTTTAVADGARCFAAVGLRADDRFVSIAHVSA